MRAAHLEIYIYIYIYIHMHTHAHHCRIGACIKHSRSFPQSLSYLPIQNKVIRNLNIPGISLKTVERFEAIRFLNLEAIFVHL